MEEIQSASSNPQNMNKVFVWGGVAILALGILGAGAYYLYNMKSTLPADGNIRKVEYVDPQVSIDAEYADMSYADISDEFYGLVEARSEAEGDTATEIKDQITDLQLPAAVKAVEEAADVMERESNDVYQFDLSNGFTVTVSYLDQANPVDLNEYAKLVVARWPFTGDQPEDSIVILDSLVYFNMNANGDLLVMIVKDSNGKVVGGVDARYSKILGGNDFADYEGLSPYSLIAPDRVEMLERLANNIELFAGMVSVKANAPRLIIEADVREDTTDIRHELPDFTEAAKMIAAQSNFKVPTFARNLGTITYSGVEVNGGYALIETDHSEIKPVDGLESMLKTQVYYDVTEMESELLREQFMAAVADSEIINYQYGDEEFTTLSTETEIAELSIDTLMDNLDTLTIAFTGKAGSLPTVTVSDDYLDVYSLGDVDAIVTQRFVVELVK